MATRNNDEFLLPSPSHPQYYPVDYRKDLSDQELTREFINDDRLIIKGQRLYKYQEYEDSREDNIFWYEELLLTITEVHLDGSVSLQLDRQSGIVGGMYTFKNQYKYRWDLWNHTLTSSNPADRYPCFIYHVLRFFIKEDTPRYDEPN